MPSEKRVGGYSLKTISTVKSPFWPATFRGFPQPQFWIPVGADPVIPNLEQGSSDLS